MHDGIRLMRPEDPAKRRFVREVCYLKRAPFGGPIVSPEEVVHDYYFMPRLTEGLGGVGTNVTRASRQKYFHRREDSTNPW
jgi:hypothetical protein